MFRRSLVFLFLATLFLVLPATAQQQTSPAAAPKADAGEISKTANPELVGLLTKELNITPKQAEAGSGAVFGYAKTKLTPENYAKVEKAVPGVAGLVKAAPAETKAEPTTGGSLGSLASAAGSQLGGTAGATAALAPAFQKIGISGETATKFVPVVLGYVTKKGGSGVGDILGSVLK